MQNNRESNIELLRIIVMLFILMHHLIVHALCPSVMSGVCGLSVEYVTYSIMEGFFYVGVDVFILISGYFGIRLRARRIWSLYLQLAFYCIIAYLFGVAVGSATFVPHTLITKSLFIFSHASSWWFVICYIMLMFLSPFLNYGMKMMTKKQFLFSLLCMTFLQVYLGWFWQKPAYDTSGYSLLNFIYIYLIGGYLHRFVSDSNSKLRSILVLLLYALCALFFGGCNILRLFIDATFGNLWAYNNPVTIIGAIGLFLYVRSCKFNSNIVNILGGGVFAVYLLTDIGYVGDVLYQTFGNFAQTIEFLPLRIATTLVVAVILLLVICSLDLLRARIMRPIICAFDWVDKRIDNG